MYVRGIDIKPEHADCTNCPFRFDAWVPGHGSDKADVVIVLDHPHRSDVLAGKPNLLSNQIMVRLLKDIGVHPDRIYVTYVCSCSAEVKLKKKDIQYCSPRLLHEIAERNPKVVIPMGDMPMRALTPYTSIKQSRGLLYRHPILDVDVVPTYNPYAAVKNPGLYHDIEVDLRFAFGDRTVVSEEVNYTVISNYRELYDAVDMTAEYLTLDVETDSAGDLLCVGIKPHGDCLVRVVDDNALKDKQVRQLLSGWLTKIPVIGHNMKFDIQQLWKAGIQSSFGGDTMLMHYALDKRKGTHGLKQLATTFLNVGDYDAELKPYKSVMEDIPREVLYKYNAQDITYTEMLYDMFSSMMTPDESRLYWNILLPVATVLAKMEYRGTQLDMRLINQMETRLEQDMKKVLERMYKMVGEFNPNSPNQLVKILYEDLGLPIPGKLSTDERALTRIAEYHEFPKLLLEYRTYKKMLSTYVLSLKEKADHMGRIHGSFNVHGTETGRLSSSRPNLQNIPARGELGTQVKNLFIATPGYTLIQADYSQAELRCLAWYSGDENLKGAFTSGLDIHTATAAGMFNKKPEDVTPEERQLGKTINFAVVYGAGPDKVAETAGCTREEAEHAIELWFKTNPKAKQWLDRMADEGVKNGYVTTPMGFTRKFPVITPKNEGSVRRQSTNTLVQSLAAHMTLLSLIELDKVFEGTRTHLLLTVHDSIVLETADNVMDVARKVKEVMVEVPARYLAGVPFEVEVEIGTSWGNLEVVNFDNQEGGEGSQA